MCIVIFTPFNKLYDSYDIDSYQTKCDRFHPFLSFYTFQTFTPFCIDIDSPDITYVTIIKMCKKCKTKGNYKYIQFRQTEINHTKQ